MGRSIDQEHPTRTPEERPVSGIGPAKRAGHAVEKSTDAASSRSRLAEIIDRESAGKPSMSEFIGRLESQGVAVLPSIQSSGRLNGVSYRFEGTTLNGSAIGRAYTASGLQSKKGIDYQPARDNAALTAAVDRGGRRRDTPVRADAIERTDLRVRDAGVTPNQKETLADIGKFRTVAASDLVSHRYAGNYSQFGRDMRSITERGLAERRVITHDRGKKQIAVVVLTVAGRNLLRRSNSTAEGHESQQFYAGFVKPSEVLHDVGIYRMYQQEAARIEREGGTIRRVVLDFELKKRVFAELNKPGVSRELARKQEIATSNGLSVVEGRVVFPDLRIEYETRDQEMAKVDLELTTGHYKASQIDAKRAAGLKIYAPDSGLGSPAHHDTEIASGLVSL
jgi:hypothetical protein